MEKENKRKNNDAIDKEKEDKTKRVNDKNVMIIKAGELEHLTQILMDAVESICSLKRRIHLVSKEDSEIAKIEGMMDELLRD